MKLTLTKETLAELTTGELGRVNGAAPPPTYTCDTFCECVERVTQALVLPPLPVTSKCY